MVALRLTQSLKAFVLFSLLVLFFVSAGCAGKEKQETAIAEVSAPAPPRIVVRTVPERANDLQIVTAIEDLLSLAGLSPRTFSIESKDGKVTISGETEPSRSLDSVLALTARLKGVRAVETSFSEATVSGSTTAVEEGPGFLRWFVTLFWPILSLIGAAFIAIAFLYFQTRLIKKQLARRRELATKAI